MKKMKEVKIIIIFCCMRDTMSSYLVIFHRCLLPCLKEIVRILSKSAEICFSLRGIKTPPPYEAKGWTKEIPMSRSCRSNNFFILILFILIFILIPLLLTISRRHRFLLHAIITVFPACFLSLEEDSRLRLCYNKGHRRVRQRSIHVHSSLPPP